MKFRGLILLKNRYPFTSSITSLHKFSKVRTITTLNDYNRGNENSNQNSFCKWALFGIVGGLSFYTIFNEKNRKLYAQSSETFEAGKLKAELPTFTMSQVKEHSSLDKGVWIVYKNGVYDITKFIESHPGGSEKISLAAGASIEPFWSIYAVHHKNEVYEILEELRIGNLSESDIEAQKQANKASANSNDAFQNEPDRHPLLKIVSQKPFNAETPSQLNDTIVTPNELHFKRNHLPVPKINIQDFKLEISSVFDGSNSKTLTIEDLKTKFQIYTIPVTIQCAGNRRKAMFDYKPVQGLMWGQNAISTAEWTGVRLKDVLEYLGIDLKNENIKHVHFVGLDSDPTGSTYGASIPIDKVLSDNGDVLIAFQMNGVDIPLDHGFPLRAIAPGIIGARSVKWLSKIILSNEESKSHWQQKDYKLLPPSVNNLNEANFSQSKAIQECPIQSAITEPTEGAIIKKENDTLKVKGYAYSGGGNSIDNVRVSLDDGKTWQYATLKKLNQPLYRSWAWTLWEIEVDIPKDLDSLKIVCVATDSNENTQPETAKSLWNLRGLLNNSWHSVNVNLK